jgi:hypothetical protein
MNLSPEELETFGHYLELLAEIEKENEKDV